MSEGKNIEIHTVSAINPQDRDKWIASASKTIGTRQKTEAWPESVEVNLSKNETYREVVSLVKDDLRERYLRAGVKIQDSDFPEITLLKQGWIQKFSSEVGNFGQSGGMANRAVYEVSGSGDLLLDITFIHHETDHELGKEFAIVDEKGHIANPQLGYIHILGHGEQETRLASNVYRHERGRVLEEGVVQYNAVEFVLNANDPLCVKAREDFVQKIKGRQLSTNNQPSVRELCLTEIEKRSPRQMYTRLLVETLILGAKRIDPEEGNRMEADLLKTRIKPSNTRSLMDRVDGVFGNGTFSEILKLDIRNVQEIKEYINKLRTTAGLQMI